MRTKKLFLLLLALGVLATGCTSDDGDGGAAEDPAGEGGDAALPDATGAVGAPTDAPTAEGETTPADTGTSAPSAGGDTLAAVQERGSVICGVNDAVPGFGFTDEQGNFSGFDIDFCRAIAAGVLGDPEAVEFRPLTADQRFTALGSGEIDVLVRNTTWTATRDGAEGATFLTTTYYDGQGMMVRTGEFESIDDMAGTAICVLQGTTTEANLATRFAGIDYEPVTFPDNDTLQAAFVEGRCDGWTSDRSQLAGVRSNFPEGPEALTILDEVFSKEPLGPAVRDGDVAWAQAVDWVTFATITAEELGITQDNVEEMAGGDDDAIKAFLGQPVGEDEAVIMPELGLDPSYATDVISAVGNYGEIFERNVGSEGLGLDRGINALWTADPPGLHYAPPYR